MMQIDVQIPALLQHCVGSARQVTVVANRLDDAIVQLRSNFPTLRRHIWDDTGALRKHVLIFYNDTAIRWLDSLDIPLQPGDRIAIVQAVSGG